jgi:fatty acid hydroxylase domain-containing protein 2
MDMKKLKHVIAVVMANQTVVGIPFIYVAFKIMAWRGCSFGRELPTFHWVVFELFIFTLVEEVFFYYGHRYVVCFRVNLVCSCICEGILKVVPIIIS